MQAEGERYDEYSEEDLKWMLEKAQSYQERSKLRSLIRNIKKSRGELKGTTNAGYKRHHQVEPSTFKLDQPAYFNHSVDTASNRRRAVTAHTPKPKHWIPDMMPANGVEATPQGPSGAGSSSFLSPNTHSSAERAHSCEMEEGYGKKAQAGRTQSYGFEQQLQQSQSPDLGYSESGQSLERPSESSDHTEGSDVPNQDRETATQQPLSSQTANDSRSQSGSESQPEELPEETRYTPNKYSNPAGNTYNSTRRVNQERSAESEEKSPLSNQADGELDQLTQKLAYSENPEEDAILRKQIRETRERSGKGHMKKHTSFIKIDVKKGSSRAESPLSPLSPQHSVDDIPVIEEALEQMQPSESREVDYGQQPDLSPHASTSSPEQVDVLKPDPSSPDELSDEMEDGVAYTDESNRYSDHTQLGSDQLVVGRTGKRPTFKGDGSIDFTTVLVKAEKSPSQSRHSPKLGVEQHSFTNVLRRISSPARTKKSPEPQQVNFKDVLTNKVVTNQHKLKMPPLVPNKPAVRNGTSPNTVANPEDYEESLPQQMNFHSEPLQRSPSPDQLPVPFQDMPDNSNSNNCREDAPLTESQELSETQQEVNDDENSTAEGYRRNSLQMAQEGRKKLREFNRKKSLSKLRMSITEDLPLIPTQISIPEDGPQTVPEVQDEISADPFLSSPHKKSSLTNSNSPTKSPSVERSDQKLSDPVNISSYEQRKMERRKKRELSGKNKSEEDPQIQGEGEKYLSVRDKKSGQESSGVSVKSARESYLKTTGIPNDRKNTRSPTASPNSHSSRTLAWAQSRVTSYNVLIKDLTNSWRDGLAFCAVIHSFVPENFDFDSLTPDNPKENLELAFQVASEFGVERLMDPEDILEMAIPDQRCIMTYLSSIYKVFVQN